MVLDSQVQIPLDLQAQHVLIVRAYGEATCFLQATPIVKHVSPEVVRLF